MDVQFDPQKVIDALSQRIATLTAENATLVVLFQDATAAHAKCASTDTQEG